ncbi:SMP-30/gluconolactonase/LRE family protein [Amycolatopsis pithecellobii]|uniref:Gluconolactonase n=1 Tax=Amycolatopsis pithecellobii TaxID=664692 RepID=A0A6N7YQ87_9PSEU|nr:SMP-30/gluconolactonase/LRE family protein [Amycolatopsis pithecellobii]MTD55175.1 gluconolactonase [Amycolatopsis pithecellobii]
MTEFDVVLPGRSFLEGARWRDGRIWVADCYAREVVSVREDGSDQRVEAIVEGQPSGMGFLPDGRLLVASMLDNRIVRREFDGSLVTHADLNGPAKSEINDMAVDPLGRCWVGCFGFDLTNGAAYEPAPLIRVDPDGAAAVVADRLGFPNGVTCDGKVLVVAETFAARLTAFDVLGDGSLGRRRVWAKFGEEPEGTDGFARFNAVDVAPDGVGEPDAEGAIWVADATHHRALRVGEGGAVLDEVVVGDAQVFAVALGGADGRTLFLAVSPNHFKTEREHTRDSILLSRRVGVPLARTVKKLEEKL